MGKVVCFGEILLRLSAPGKEVLMQSPQLAAHVGGAETNITALHVSHSNERKHFLKISDKLILYFEASVDERLLKVKRAQFAAGIGEPQFAIVIV